MKLFACLLKKIAGVRQIGLWNHFSTDYASCMRMERCQLPSLNQNQTQLHVNLIGHSSRLSAKVTVVQLFHAKRERAEVLVYTLVWTLADLHLRSLQTR
jgi:hypothetical protein